MKELINQVFKSDQLKDVSLDVIESILDSEITSEILKELPIIKSIHAIVKIRSSYVDRIFIKKSLATLLEVGEVDLKDKEAFLSELTDINSSGTEKLLMAIEKADSIEKCKIIGRVIRMKVKGQIDLHGFNRILRVIQNAYLPDLILIKDFNIGVGKLLYEGEYYSLIQLGLIYQDSSDREPISFQPDSHDDKGHKQAYITGGNINFKYFLSETGEILRKHFDQIMDQS